MDRSYSRAEVRIECLPELISMEIRDNGKGYDTRGEKRNRLGLLGMRERVEMIGGKFRVESVAGKSTTVHVEVPVGKDMARRRR
jgi:signal transduction histidine kinase